MPKQTNKANLKLSSGEVRPRQIGMAVAARLLRSFRFALFFVALTGVFLYTRVSTPTHVSAATSSYLNFQARLLNTGGAIVPDGTYNVEFKIYDSLAAGASAQGVCVGGVTDDCLWRETRTAANKVTVKSGYLSVYLGQVTALPTTINWDQDLYLTMNIGGTAVGPTWDGEMTPRLKLTAVPYAMSAGQLAKASGANTGTLSFNTIANNPVITLPDATGTVALLQGAQTFTGATIFSSAGTALSVTNDATIGGVLSLNGNTTIGNATTDRLTVTSQILGATPLVFQGATDNGFATSFTFTEPTANNTITFPNASGTVQLAPASGNYLFQVPATTAANTVGPTAASVVGLTVNATTSTSAVAAIFNQAHNTSPADTVQINTTNTAGTQVNGLSVSRNGVGGTTTNLLNLTNTAGTATNAITIAGTFTNLINAPNFSVTNAGNGDFAGTLTAGTSDAFQVAAGGNITVAATAGTGINFNNTGLVTDISLQNGETIDNDTDGTVRITAANALFTGNVNATGKFGYSGTQWISSTFGTAASSDLFSHAGGMASYDVFAYAPVAVVEYDVAGVWTAWASSNIERAFDNNINTQATIDASHKKFRFVLDVGAFSIPGLFVIERAYASPNPNYIVTIETDDNTAFTSPSVEYSGVSFASGEISYISDLISNADQYYRVTIDSSEIFSLSEISAMSNRVSNGSIISPYQKDYTSAYVSQGLAVGYSIGQAVASNGLSVAGSTGIGIAAPSAKLHVLSTTEQLRLGYDASNYLSATVGSTGGVTLDAIGAGANFTFSDNITANGGITCTDCIALGGETSGNYVASITTGSGLQGGVSSEGSAPTLSLGALTADWNQSGAFDILLSDASSELRIKESVGNAFYGTLDVADLAADKTYVLPNFTGATADICLSTGNCEGIGATITGSGIAGRIAKFDATDNITSSIITESGSNISVAGTITATGGSSLTLGAASTATGAILLKNSSNANTLTLQSGTTGSNLVLTLPTADGGASDCLKTNGSGILAFAACTGGGGGGVTSVNSLTGVLTLQGTTNQVNVASGGGTITLSTPQNIHSAASPTFVGMTLTGDLAVNGNDITSTGALTVTPAANTNFNVSLSGTGDFTVNTNQLYVDTSTARVGIGTSTPSTKLDVQGGVASQNGYLLADAATDNMVADGDMEQGVYGWTIFGGGGTIASTAADRYSGQKSMQVNGQTFINSNDLIPVDPTRDVLQLEAYAKKSVAGGTPGVLYFGYLAYDVNKAVITTSPCGSYCYFAASGLTLPADGNWHKLSATTTGEPASAGAGVFPQFPFGTKFVQVMGLVNYSASADAVTLIDHVTVKRINHGPLYVGNNFTATNMTDQYQSTQLYTNASNNFVISPAGSVIQAATNNAVDLGLSGTSFRTGYFGTSVRTPYIDTIVAGTLSLGTTTANAISIGSSGITTTNHGALTVTQLLTGSLGATISGAAIQLNVNSNNPTSINTGTSTGQITLGGSAAPLVINSTAFDVTVGGAVSGVTTIAASGTLTLSGAAPQIDLTNGTSNYIQWNANGVAPPSFTTSSAGTKLRLYPAISVSTADYAIGIESSTLWQSVPNTSSGYKWYGGTTQAAALSGTGVFNTALGFQINGAAGTGTYLRGNGTNFVQSAIQAADIPDLAASYIRNQTTQQASANFNVSGSGTVAGNFIISGAVTPGGTGLLLPYASSTPNSGPGIRWSDGTLANTFGFYVSGGLNFQGNAGNPSLYLRTPTVDGTLGTVITKLGTASTTDTSYFNGGNVGIGTTAPTDKLHVYNGNLTVDLGNLKFTSLAAPGAPTAAINAVAGNLTGNYRYAVTFVTAQGETSIGAQSNLVAPAAQRVNLTAIPTGTSGVVTQRKVYRTLAGGTAFYLIATIADNTTTTYADNTADGSLTVIANANNATGGRTFLNGVQTSMYDPYSANSANGYSALSSNTSGSYNTASGYAALQANTTGIYNTAVGGLTLINNTSGHFNVAVGMQALTSNTTGIGNVSSGYASLLYNRTGNYNTASGYAAGQGVSTLSDITGNSLFGYLTGNALLTGGNYNTMLGYSAGSAVTTGTNNTFIGVNAGINVTTGSNNIIIGQNVNAASATGSNQLNIGNAIYGDLGTGFVGIGTSSPGAGLDVANATLRVRPHASAAHRFLVQTIDSVSTELSDNYGFLAFSTSTSPGGVPAERLRITTTGNVGIGTTGPDSKLHVVGGICAETADTGCVAAAGTIRSTVTTGTAPLQVTSTTMVDDLNVELHGGYTESQLGASLRSGYMASGGGTVGYNNPGTGVSWSSRFIVISNSKGTDFAASGYFDITQPVDGTVITGANTANITVAGGAIPLPTWCALYYILPLGSALTSLPANFRVVCYTGSNFSIPSNWVLIAGHNGDNTTVRFVNGLVLRSGQTGTAGTTNNVVFNTSATSPLFNATTGFQVNGAAASGNYLRGNGTNFVSSAIQAADIPSGSGNYIQNQNAGPQATANFNISGTGTAATFNATTGINTGAGAGSQRIDASGNLTNIGTIGASGAATIGGLLTANAGITTTGADFNFKDAGVTDSTAVRLFSSGGSLYLQNGSGNAINFRSKNGTLHSAITDAGNWGLGTSGPDSRLHVIGGVCIETSDSGCAATSGTLRVGATAPVSNALITAIANGNSFEFGHTNAAGYRSTLGAEASNGAPFLAFNAEAGSTGNTYRTRGLAGAIIKSNLAGSLLFGGVPTATADNQAFVQSASLTPAGDLTVASDLAASGGGLTLTGTSTITAGGSQATYGGFSLNGTKNGYSGINFRSGATNYGTLMVHPDYQGFFNDADNGWDWYFNNGTMVAGTIPAANVAAGTFGAGAFNFQGAVGGVTTLTTSGAINGQTISTAANFTGTLTVASTLTATGRIVANGGSGTSYSTAPIEIATTATPRIAFHWPGVVASQLGMDAAGIIRTFDNPGTGYATFAAANYYVAGTQIIDTSRNLVNIGTITSGLINGQTISSSASFTNTVAVASSITTPNYQVTAASGNGICFWQACGTYQVAMGNGAEYVYGGVTDYSIKMSMNNQSNRGFTWGVSGAAPTASLTTTGNMQLAGNLAAMGSIGVGVAAPQAKLHVVGGTYLNGDLGISGQSGIPSQANNFNVAPNSSFEVRTNTDALNIVDGWNVTNVAGNGTAVTTRANDSQSDGTYAMKLANTGTTSFTFFTMNSYIPVEPSTSYMSAIDIRHDTVASSCSASVYVRVYWYTSALAASSPTYLDTVGAGTTTTSWATYGGTVTSPANATFARLEYYNFQNAGSCTRWYDNAVFRPVSFTGDVSFTSTLNVNTGYKVAGGATAGTYLRGNGTNFVQSAIQAGDLPSGSGNYIQNQAGLQSSANFNIDGSGTAGSLTAPSHLITVGVGNGVCFWQDCTNYKISMGNTAEYLYGPVSVYSIKNTMWTGAGFGWTWGQPGVAPIAALDNTGKLQLASSLSFGSGGTSNGSILSTVAGTLNIRTGTTGLNIDNNAGSANLMSVANSGATTINSSAGGGVIGLTVNVSAQATPLKLKSTYTDSGTLAFQMGTNTNSENSIISLNSAESASKNFSIVGHGLGAISQFRVGATTTLLDGDLTVSGGDITLSGTSTLTAGGAQSLWGAASINGTKNGYGGLNFRSGASNLGTLMVDVNNQGFINDLDNAWDWYFSNGVLTVGTVPVANLSGTLPVTSGGTGAGSFTTNGVLYGNSTGALGVTAAGATNQCLIGNTGSAPTWGTCGIGGSGTNGYATFWNGTSSITGDSSFFWDNTNKRLGIGTSGPSDRLHVAVSDGSNNVLNSLRLERTNSAGAGAAGLGTAISMYVENDSSVLSQMGRIETVSHLANNTQERSNLRFSTMNSGALTEWMRLGWGVGTAGALYGAEINGPLWIDTTFEDNERLCHSGADGNILSDINIRDCTVAGEDFAEYAIVKTPGAEPGDLVYTLGNDPSNPTLTAKAKTTQAYQHHSGVISTNAFIDVLGQDQYKGKAGAYPVALAGRVPLKVSLENGPIQVGDPLVSSSVPGVVMKGTKGAYVVGFAQEAYDGSVRVSAQVLDQERIYNADLDDRTAYNSDPSKWASNVGKIIVEYKPTWYIPELSDGLQSSSAQFETLNVSDLATINQLNVTTRTTTKDLTVTGTATIRTLTVTDAATIKDLAVTGIATIENLKVKDIEVTGGLVVKGGISTAIANKMANYAVTLSDSIITADASQDENFTVTLPTAVGIPGRQFTIKKTDGSNNPVTIITHETVSEDGTGTIQTIDGTDIYTLATQYKYIVIVSDGSNWIIVGNN